ncbi:hypothetical protein AAEH73_07740 [Shewanella algae]
MDALQQHRARPSSNSIYGIRSILSRGLRGATPWDYFHHLGPSRA